LSQQDSEGFFEFFASFFKSGKLVAA